jgi:signal transduction histidine kinase
VAAVFLYTNHLIKGLNAQADAQTQMLAKFCAVTTFPAAQSADLAGIFEEAIRPIRFPIVLTDTEGRPMAWRGVGIDASTVTVEQSLDLDLAHPPTSGALRQILALVERMDRENNPIPMLEPTTDRLLGYVHYGDPGIVKELRWIPFVQVLILFAFVGLGYAGYRSVKIGEQRYIWVGMAKETAHQLGTPLSSLLGWTEVLRDRAAGQGGTEARLERAGFEQILKEIESDVERLNKIALRFSNVGSQPRLQPQDVVPVVRGAVHYLSRRLPQLGQEIEIVEEYEAVPMVSCNPELLEWALENLLKNAVDASRPAGGRIEVSVRRRKETESVEISIRDHGRGMAAREQRRVFEPGYTTKKRGWGLGLTLTRRIVEEYHGGRLSIRESEPGRGSTFVISFPV